MANPKDFVLREFRHMLPPTIFFLISFNIIVLTVELLSTNSMASTGSHAAASFAALICGKAVLIADKLPFFNRFPDRPLIWNAVWKAALYVIVTLLFRLAETFVAAWTSDYGFSEHLADEAAHFSWARFAAIQLWLVILFFSYAGFGELVNQVGRDRVVQWFLGPVPGSSERSRP